MSRVPLKDMKAILDRATYHDDYDVEGSTFIVCRICEHSSDAGILRKPGWHAKDCPVPRLKKKYDQRGIKEQG
jgi:hypothetical protein